MNGEKGLRSQARDFSVWTSGESAEPPEPLQLNDAIY